MRWRTIRDRFRFGLRARWQDLKLRAQCHWYDVTRADRAMNWRRPGRDYRRISAELYFWYHKLEKGLCLPAPRPMWGEDAVRHTLRMMRAWAEAGFDLSDPVHAGAIEALRDYRAAMTKAAPVDILQAIDAAVAAFPEVAPRPAPAITKSSFEALEALAVARRSIRDFDPAPVPIEAIRAAIRVAQLSPSACNRQPTRVHLFTDRARIDALLALQNGNAGFGHTIPALALITGDASCFKDPTERHELHLDAGLFLMSFLLALEAEGLSSCCLNWCVPPGPDRRVHALAGLPESEWIVTFLAIGRARDGAAVARSPRRRADDMLILHD